MLRLNVEAADGERRPVEIEVTSAYNFGYAARDQEGLKQHIAEQAAMGMPTPTTVPAIFPVVPRQITESAAITVVGTESYAEVEYALINAGDEGWLVTVASDHSDREVERHDVPRAKNMTPDVLAPTAWRLDDVVDHFDELELICSCRDSGGQETVTQQGALSGLLAPDALREILERRLGAEPGVGTVILSGTVDGEPPSDVAEWKLVIRDPKLGREISHTYTVTQLPTELEES